MHARLRCPQNWNGLAIILNISKFFKSWLFQIDSNGVVNVDVASRIVNENFATQEWEQDASDVLVEKCAKEVAGSTSKPIDTFGLQCSSKAGEFVYCMWRELFLTCPADKQINTKQCDKLRSVLKRSNDNQFKN